MLDMVAKVESRMEQIRRGSGVPHRLFLGIAFRFQVLTHGQGANILEREELPVTLPRHHTVVSRRESLLPFLVVP